MKKRFLVLLVSASVLMAGAAKAQGKDDGAFYMGLEGAYADAGAADVVTGFNKTSERNNVAAWRVLMGYRIDQNIGLELGYFSTGNYEQAAASPSGTRYDAKMRIKGIDLAVIYKFTESVPGLFLKGGISDTRIDAQTAAYYSTGEPVSVSESISGAGYLLGVGYDFSLGGGLTARLGYSRYGRVGGDGGSNLNLVSGGLIYRF